MGRRAPRMRACISRLSLLDNSLARPSSRPPGGCEQSAEISHFRAAPNFSWRSPPLFVSLTPNRIRPVDIAFCLFDALAMRVYPLFTGLWRHFGIGSIDSSDDRQRLSLTTRPSRGVRPSQLASSAGFEGRQDRVQRSSKRHRLHREGHDRERRPPVPQCHHGGPQGIRALLSPGAAHRPCPSRLATGPGLWRVAVGTPAFGAAAAPHVGSARGRISS